jgi:drug/metabolite transporter (DMT)-like permease
MGGLEISFAAMILLTTAARALLFYSLNPLMSAIIGRLILGDDLKVRSIAALIFATAAVFLTFAPGLIGQDTEAGASIEGDMCGVAAGMCQSSFICLVRHVHRKDPEMTLVPSAAAGSIVSILTVLLVSLGTGTSLLPNEDASLQFFGSVAGSGLGVAILLICLNIAPRTLSGAEVSLITLLETILGPFFIFLWFGETPGPWTLAGGALLFATLVLHEAAGMFDRHADENLPQAAVHVSVDDKSTEKVQTGRRDNEVELSTCI